MFKRGYSRNAKMQITLELGSLELWMAKSSLWMLLVLFQALLLRTLSPTSH